GLRPRRARLVYRPWPRPWCGVRRRPSPGRRPSLRGPSCSPSCRRRSGRAAPPRAWPESLSRSSCLLLLMKTPPSRRWARRAAVGDPPERARPACLALAFACAARFRRSGARRLLRLEPRSDHFRVRVRIHDGDHRNAELVRLGDRDALLLRIHDEQRSRQPAHVLDARQVLLELDALAVEQQLLLLGVVLELAFGGALLQLFQPFDLLLDGLEVGERAAQPALGHVERAAALRLRLED